MDDETKERLRSLLALPLSAVSVREVLWLILTLDDADEAEVLALVSE